MVVNEPAVVVNDESFKQARHIFDARFDLTKLEPGVKWGENVPMQWKRMAQILIDQGLIPQSYDIDATYTNEFTRRALEKIK